MSGTRKWLHGLEETGDVLAQLVESGALVISGDRMLMATKNRA